MQSPCPKTDLNCIPNGLSTVGRQEGNPVAAHVRCAISPQSKKYSKDMVPYTIIHKQNWHVLHSQITFMKHNIKWENWKLPVKNGKGIRETTQVEVCQFSNGPEYTNTYLHQSNRDKQCTIDRNPLLPIVGRAHTNTGRYVHIKLDKRTARFEQLLHWKSDWRLPNPTLGIFILSTHLAGLKLGTKMLTYSCCRMLFENKYSHHYQRCVKYYPAVPTYSRA